MGFCLFRKGKQTYFTYFETKVLWLRKVLFYIKILSCVCSTVFWKKTKHVTHYRYSLIHAFFLLAYLMKSPDIRRSLEHQIICKKYILRCSKFFISGFFGGRKWSSEVIFLKILPNPSAERKAVGQREKMFTLCLLSKSLKANACT